MRIDDARHAECVRKARVWGKHMALIANQEDISARARRPSLSRFVAPILTAVWLGVAGIGLAGLWRYEATPGKVGAPSANWPDDSQIERRVQRPTLVVFAHPRCPCTRASLGELALIMAHCPGRVDAHVLFFKPSGFPNDWEKTDLWRSAEAIPGVKAASDSDGSEAKRFGAATSGHSLLYDQKGRLLFSGGITASRGHSGDNAGRNAIESLLMGRAASQNQTSVFGCPLLGRDVAGKTEVLRCCQE